eukprot:scaffold678_cov98-Cylindrotheca_fusiformis.AAC.4
MANRVSQILFRRQAFRPRNSLLSAIATVGDGAQRLFNPTVVAAAGATPAFVQSRSLSSFDGASTSSSSFIANPSYQIYGENVAFTMSYIMPTFRVVGNKNRPLVFVDKQGRLLLQLNPRSFGVGGTKFAWDRPLRFALSAEEVSTLLAALSSWQPVEFVRQVGGGQCGFHHGADNNICGLSLQKVFRAIPNRNDDDGDDDDGSIELSIDYELDGRGGQNPPNPNDAPGPMGISVTTAEYQVIKALMEYSIPRLLGWPQLMDRPLEQLMQTDCNNNNNNDDNDDVPSPHNYKRGSGGATGERQQNTSMKKGVNIGSRGATGERQQNTSTKKGANRGSGATGERQQNTSTKKGANRASGGATGERQQNTSTKKGANRGSGATGERGQQITTIKKGANTKPRVQTKTVQKTLHWEFKV